MLWFLLILFVILVIFMLFSGDSKKVASSAMDKYMPSQESPAPSQPSPAPSFTNQDNEVHAAGRTVLLDFDTEQKKDNAEAHLTSAEKKAAAHARKVERLKTKAKDIFSDQESSVKDFSHMTPEQAERKLERLKEEDGWVEDSVYKGLIRIIHGDYPIMEIPEAVLKGSPQDMERWFLGSHDSFGFSNEVFKTIASVLKPYHEANLLTELEDVPIEKLEEWMNEKKRQGIFFSNKVYSKMRKKWLSQYNL